VGSKNKSTNLVKPQIDSFQKQLKEWDEQESKVNFKELCEKLQEALAKSYVESDAQRKTIETLNREIHARDVIITYLEIRKV